MPIKSATNMKRLAIAIIMMMPLMAMAQNTWEKPETEKKERTALISSKKDKEYEYAKYLGNVVPEVNGEVVWEKTFNNSKNADENYAAMLSFLTGMTQEEDQLKGSTISIVNKAEHKIVAHFEEWMVFTNSFLSLDRTRFIYTLVTECKDNQVYVKIFRISYWYEEQRDGGERFKAEEWITDKYGLNKKHTRLAKISGKFRRKTVDRIEQIYNNIGVSLMAQ